MPLDPREMGMDNSRQNKRETIEYTSSETLERSKHLLHATNVSIVAHGFLGFPAGGRTWASTTSGICTEASLLPATDALFSSELLELE
eukprot:529733-Amphidinium_carterae.3